MDWTFVKSSLVPYYRSSAEIGLLLISSLPKRVERPVFTVVHYLAYLIAFSGPGRPLRTGRLVNSWPAYI